MTAPGTDPVRPSVETLTAQLDKDIARLAGALVRETELIAALRKIEAERDEYKRLAGIADTLARECRIHESRAEAAEADNARLRGALAVDPWHLGCRKWQAHVAAAIRKGEQP
jgi:hypothetical protein